MTRGARPLANDEQNKTNKRPSTGSLLHPTDKKQGPFRSHLLVLLLFLIKKKKKKLANLPIKVEENSRSGHTFFISER